MSITFRVVADAPLHSGHAAITPAQLAAFRRFARENDVLPDAVVSDDPEFLGWGFEADVLGFALATICALFDHDPAVIAVVEEAQFLGRRLNFWGDGEGLSTVCVASAVGTVRDLELPWDGAYAVLGALGLETDNLGSLAVSDLRRRIGETAVRDRFAACGLQQRFETLRAFASVSPNGQDPRLVWA